MNLIIIYCNKNCGKFQKIYVMNLLKNYEPVIWTGNSNVKKDIY